MNVLIGVVHKVHVNATESLILICYRYKRLHSLNKIKKKLFYLNCVCFDKTKH